MFLSKNIKIKNKSTAITIFRSLLRIFLRKVPVNLVSSVYDGKIFADLHATIGKRL